MPINHSYSDNPRINILIERILDELCPFLEEQAREISDLTAIGKALGTGEDISTLLDMILSIAKRFTQADGGTLYLLDPENQNLVFHVIYNESLNIRRSSKGIDLPSVPLYLSDGTKNLSNVSSYVFHTGEIINIQNVHETDRFQFDGTKKFDAALNYQSRSMVVIPMQNHEEEIIGILQLINAVDPVSGNVVAFSRDAQEKAAALASQASVILTQQMLILEMKELFEAFIKAIAISIDEKSKHTGSHIERVTALCMMIAEAVNKDTRHFKDVRLTSEQLDELRMAALMHDTGKITTPDHIINKARRLETVCDRFELIRTRWLLLKTNLMLRASNEKLALLDHSGKQDEMAAIDRKTADRFKSLDHDLEAISKINTCKTNLTPEQLNTLETIRKKSDTVLDQSLSYLTDDEYTSLSVVTGTLNPQERVIINSHAIVTQKILNRLPWPKKLANIPAIAGAHHEKLDGSGYPRQLNESHLNIQARILAISDIFEALSAQDRPYKKPMPLSQTKGILEQMGKDGLLDNDIITLFFRNNIHLTYADQHLDSTQIDL